MTLEIFTKIDTQLFLCLQLYSHLVKSTSKKKGKNKKLIPLHNIANKEWFNHNCLLNKFHSVRTVCLFKCEYVSGININIKLYAVNFLQCVKKWL